MTKPIRRRRRIGSHSRTGLPSTSTSPSVASIRRLTSFSVVVLPQPLWPSSTSVSPLSTFRLKPEIVSRLPSGEYRTLRNSIITFRSLPSDGAEFSCSPNMIAVKIFSAAQDQDLQHAIMTAVPCRFLKNREKDATSWQKTHLMLQRGKANEQERRNFPHR